MDLNTIVTAAQIERGLRYYGCSFHPQDDRGNALRFVKSYETFECGDLILCEEDGHFYIMTVSRIADNIGLDQAARCKIWASGAVTEHRGHIKELREQEQRAVTRIGRSIAMREAKEAMQNIGLDASTLFIDAKE